jgi:hypothetical protein
VKQLGWMFGCKSANFWKLGRKLEKYLGQSLSLGEIGNCLEALWNRFVFLVVALCAGW